MRQEDLEEEDADAVGAGAQGAWSTAWRPKPATANGKGVSSSVSAGGAVEMGSMRAELLQGHPGPSHLPTHGGAGVTYGVSGAGSAAGVVGAGMGVGAWRGSGGGGGQRGVHQNGGFGASGAGAPAEMFTLEDSEPDEEAGGHDVGAWGPATGAWGRPASGAGASLAGTAQTAQGFAWGEQVVAGAGAVLQSLGWAGEKVALVGHSSSHEQPMDAFPPMEAGAAMHMASAPHNGAYSAAAAGSEVGAPVLEGVPRGMISHISDQQHQQTASQARAADAARNRPSESSVLLHGSSVLPDVMVGPGGTVGLTGAGSLIPAPNLFNEPPPNPFSNPPTTAPSPTASLTTLGDNPFRGEAHAPAANQEPNPFLEQRHLSEDNNPFSSEPGENGSNPFQEEPNPFGDPVPNAHGAGPGVSGPQLHLRDGVMGPSQPSHSTVPSQLTPPPQPLAMSQPWVPSQQAAQSQALVTSQLAKLDHTYQQQETGMSGLPLPVSTAPAAQPLSQPSPSSDITATSGVEVGQQVAYGTHTPPAVGTAAAVHSEPSIAQLFTLDDE